MTNDEAIDELKLIVGLFSKCAALPRKPDTDLPKSKEPEKDRLLEVVQYLRVCVKYSVWSA